MLAGAKLRFGYAGPAQRLDHHFRPRLPVEARVQPQRLVNLIANAA
jgi:hypothetical protein